MLDSSFSFQRIFVPVAVMILDGGILASGFSSVGFKYAGLRSRLLSFIDGMIDIVARCVNLGHALMGDYVAT